MCVCCVLSQVLFHGPFEVTASFSHMSLRFTVLVLGLVSDSSELAFWAELLQIFL